VTKVTIDESLREKLPSLGDELEFCDETGRTIGHFLPAELYRQLIYDSAEPAISDEEAERRFAEPGGRTLQEILADLEKR
jgi:hypothetical protein